MRFLRLADVRSRVGLSRSQIYRKISTGEFPKAYSLGARAVAWLESEIDGWIESRIGKHSQAEAERRASL
ncbi:MAG: AlpA family transcriptional regulator [Terracidiphilus sp.]